ncbi:MAG TPA: CDGSH iron-sulfur domain-containing protein [Micromonosporaceae bacterium]|jgi:CDGSH-type Zn-finger protein
MSEQPLASVTLCPDGPLLIRGDYLLLTADGESLDGHRNTVALCRCGKSAIKPFCDGTHKMIDFRTETPEPQ